MRIKRIIYVLICILSITFFMEFKGISALGDVTAPIVSAISVNYKEVLPGDTVNFTLIASDEETGIRNIQLILQTNGYIRRSVYYEVESQSDSYLIPYTIGKYDVVGEWYVSEIHVTDNSNNTTILISSQYMLHHSNAFDTSNTNYEILENANSDWNTPFVEDITLSKRYLEIGDTLTLNANIKDLISGVEFIDWKYTFPNKIIHKNEQFLNIFTGRVEPELNKNIVSNITLDETYPSGLYQFELLNVKDVANNQLNINNENTNTSNLSFCFNCIQLNKVDISKTEIVLDDNNLYEALNLTFEPTNATDQSIEWKSSNESVAKVINGVLVPVSNGNTTITAINSISGLSDSVNVTVDIKSAQALLEASSYFNVVESIVFSKTNVIPGDTLTMTVKLHPMVKRESSISILMGLPYPYDYLNESTFESTLEAMYDESTDSYVKDIVIDDTYYDGDYFVYKALGIETKNYFFTVSEGRSLTDIFSPSNISISKTSGTLGDKIKFQVSGILNSDLEEYNFTPYGRILLKATEPNGVIVRLSYNKTSNLFEGELTVDEKMSNDSWYIDSFSLGYSKKETDGSIVNTITRIVGNQDVLTKNIRLNISGVRNPDTNAPILNSINLASKQLEPDSLLKISVDASDTNLSGSYGYVEFINQYKSSISIMFSFNEITSKLEGENYISSSHFNGDYKPVNLEIYDKYNNRLSVSNFNEDISFTISNANEISPIPTVRNLLTTKKNLIYGDAVYLLFELDNPAKVYSYCQLEIQGPMKDKRKISFWFNENTGNLESSFLVDAYMSNGSWKISNIMDCQTNETLIQKEVFTISGNNDSNIVEPFIKGVEDGKIYDSARTIEYPGFKREIFSSPVYSSHTNAPIPSGYIFDKEGNYVLSITDRFSNQYQISFSIKYNTTTPPNSNNNPESSNDLSAITNNSNNPQITNKVDLPQPKTIEEKIEDLKNLIINSLNEEDNGALKTLIKEVYESDKNFLKGFSNNELDQFENTLLSLYSNIINFDMKNSNNLISVKGLILNSNLEQLLGGEVQNYEVNVDNVLSQKDQDLLRAYIVDNKLDENNVYPVNIDISLNGTLLSDLTYPITITLPIPEGFNRTDNHSIVHIHNGKVEILEVVFNNDNTYSFTTNKLSSFTLLKNEIINSEIIKSNNDNDWLMPALAIIAIILVSSFIYVKLKSKK